MSFLLTLCTLVVFACFGRVCLAQDDVFLQMLLSDLDSLQLTNFTSLVRQVQADPTQTTFFTTISDSSISKTLFVPNNDAFVQPEVDLYGTAYDHENTTYLSSLLLYHLLPGTWLPGDVGSGTNHTIVPTYLEGPGNSFLENCRAQVMALANTAGSLEVLNQPQGQTIVLDTLSVGHVTVHVVDAIIGVPPPYFFGLTALEAGSFMALQNVSSGTTQMQQAGFTAFIPVNSAFDRAPQEVMSADPAVLFGNHVVYGRTVYSPDFTAQTWTSSSGQPYRFAVSPSTGNSTVTLNGITANILRSDFLMANGVVHVVDQVFYNTSLSGSIGGATSEPDNDMSTSLSQSSATSAPSATFYNNTQSRPKQLGAGTVTAIVAVGTLSLAVPLVIFVVWRMRHDAKMLDLEKTSNDPLEPWNLPSPVRRITPFSTDAPRSPNPANNVRRDTGGTSSSSSSSSSHPMLPPHVFLTSGTSSNSFLDMSTSPVSEGFPPEKKETLPTPSQLPSSSNATGMPTVQVPKAVLGQPQVTTPIAMTADVVETLWQEFAQRIDRGPPPRRQSEGTVAPPKYRSGYSRR